jgi:hypothetical protein
MYIFFASSVVVGFVYVRPDGLLDLIFGILIGLGFGLTVYIISIVICGVLFSLIGEREILLPIIGVALNALIAISFLITPERGGDSCIDSGRYGEYSSCD